MLTIYEKTERGLRKSSLDEGATDLPPAGVWIDLLAPTLEEERLVETWFGLEIPSREEMREIEISSRLYEEDGAVFMTALALIDSDTNRPRTCDISFILVRNHLVTVRYETPQPIAVFLQRAPKVGPACRYADFVLAALIDAFLDRVADILERAGTEAEAVSQRVFETRSKKPMKTEDFRDSLGRIGRAADLTSKARDSLVTFSRLVTYLQAGAGGGERPKEVKQYLKTAQRDATQLADHATYLNAKMEFLLDATVGLINIEQNNIIKIFSVVAVALMPPTLIASIYGMNFHFMPELDEPWAYPLVLLTMAVLGIAPFLFFKKKGWL
ncbi:magnesium transporter CorA family protein [Lutibaculum baratangense]|uniref:Magnesium transport protein CorA n=1 Tax=Lutibaculum baratangense AMV1 TaxID=631454 RepID=V4R2K4_9HYPH|nr:magnesium transporter CorA family protein [Lutibaculum baratangense]ESR26182.1 Magnesium and cobalt transport protein CorA [Lutibaculum baratangense AMV1]